MEANGIKWIFQEIKPFFQRIYPNQIELKLLNLRSKIFLQLFSHGDMIQKPNALKFILKEFENIQILLQPGLPESWISDNLIIFLDLQESSLYYEVLFEDLEEDNILEKLLRSSIYPHLMNNVNTLIKHYVSKRKLTGMIQYNCVKRKQRSTFFWYGICSMHLILKAKHLILILW